MQTIRSLTFLALIIIATQANAWNSYGHMIVAAIAYDQLTPTAQSRATELLKLNPQYNEWIAGVNDADRDKVAFVKAATWPDYIKRAAGFTNDGETPNGPAAAQNIGYDDKLTHRYWHYIDIPFSPDNTPLIQPIAPNAKTQIATFRATLASTTATDALKSYDLVWLLHLVGDVHQPLHATSRFTQDDTSGDRGGNDVALCAKPCKNELHAFWDDVLGTSTDPEKAITTAATFSAANKRSAAISDESKWIDESFNAAKTAVYIDPIGAGIGPYTLDANYRAAARAVAKKRVALAGARLAHVINDELK